MCVHPKVKKETATSADINHDCNALSKERKCRFRNGLEGFTAPNHSYEENTQAVLDMEDLVKMGKQQKVCPFYYTRSLLPDAELVLMPYNYLFDKDMRENTLQDIAWKDAIVIFDEAHNLESFATESASFDLSQTDLAMCVAELNRALNYMMLMGDSEDHVVKKDNVTRLKALFLHFEEFLTGLNRSGAFSGEYMMEIFTKGMSINHANHHLFIDEVKKVSELLLDARGGASAGGGATSKGAPKLEHFVQCIKRVFGGESELRCMAKAKSYRVHISPKEGATSNPQQQSKGGANNSSNNKGGPITSRTLSYWCFAPSLAMQELANLDIRSILVTSGTLSPLISYSMELGISFPHTLENPHIVTKEQIHVRVIGKGVSGKLLTSSFQRRKDAEYYCELGNTLVSLAKVVPGGMLIFFPSYSVMETCLERWGGPASSSSRYNNAKKTGAYFSARNKKGSNASNRQQYSFPFTAPSIYGSNLGGSNPVTPWKRLIGAKSIVVEPRSTADLPDAISEFHKYLGMPKSKGCILMGVCRGKISEGIDFADNMSRAVVITGLPFPPAFDPKVKLKREYLDGNRASKSMTSKEAGGFGGSSDKAAAAGSDGKAALSNEKDNVTVLSGHEWYSQQAHRAVNQAIGRVIRNRNDYGAVLLLDSRYSLPGNQQGLSKWVRPHLQPDEGVGPAIGALVKFYRKAEARAKEEELARKGLVYEQENPAEKRPKQPEQSTDDLFTKVAFVQNPMGDLKAARPPEESTIGDASGAQKIDDNDTHVDESVCFIAPEQVLRRVDLDSIVKKNESSIRDSIKKSANKSLPASKGRGSIFDEVQSVVRVPALNAKSKIDTRKTAAEFFKKAQKVLSTLEFSTIRKSIVAMKQYGDKKDRKEYIKSAREVISLCIQRDQYFGRYEKEHKGTLLFLFFTLLPAAYRPVIEQIAMNNLFRRTQLGQFCKENLPQDQHTNLLKEMSVFLQKTWCGDNASSNGRKTEFLRDVQSILSLLREGENPLSSSATTTFKDLIPQRFQSSFLALQSEMKASQNIQRLRAKEARNRGEDSINTFKFRNAEVAENAPATVKSETRSIPTNSGGAVARAGAASSKPPPTQQQPIRAANPYAKKPRPLSSYVGPTKTQGNAKPLPQQAQKPAPAYARTSELSKSGKPTSQRSPRRNDPVLAMLDNVQKPFVKTTSADLARGIYSNVPTNLSCSICSKVSQKPMLGDCGHMACQSCWINWLKRSETCPICRVPVKAKSLARVVFQDQNSEGDNSRGSITLSQFCD